MASLYDLSWQAGCHGSLAIDGDASNVRRPHGSGEYAATIRRQLMSMIQHQRVHGDWGIGAPDDKVGIESGGEPALAMLQPGQPRGCGAHSLGQSHDIQTAQARLVPHGWQAELERRDAAPRLEEVTAIWRLALRRARGMIGGDEVDVSIDDGTPECFARIGVPDGRRTLALRAAIGDFLGRKGEVVRAGFARDGDTAGAGRADERQRVVR